jgi:predicted GTPase
MKGEGISMKQRRIIIIGAAGRDFHNFNTRYRQDESAEVVAFTAAQIPNIDGRKYPAELAGPLIRKEYPFSLNQSCPP